MYEKVERIAMQAGEIALKHFRQLSTLPVTSKGHLDLVTAADQEVEQFIFDRLQALFPEDGILGEEGGSIGQGANRVWVVDPIDGTFNFVRGGEHWAVSIGLLQDRVPEFGVIHVPAKSQTYTGGRTVDPAVNGRRLDPVRMMDPAQAAAGVETHPLIPTEQRLAILRFLMDEARISFRCYGSATVSLLEIATGQVDGHVGLGESTWDVVAALAILGPLGVVSTIDWGTTELSAKLRYACGRPEFLDLIAPIVPYGSQLNFETR
jgi:myo-inositol-1(or 4)-monophosphatase